MAKNREYISLKEASKMSGYSADYLGQLIRSGKLPGKQVYLNVAWMTTQEDLEYYIQNGSRKTVKWNLTSYLERFRTPDGLSTIYTGLMWAAIAILSVFVLFLVAVLAVTFDNRIDQKFEKRLQDARSETIDISHSALIENA